MQVEPGLAVPIGLIAPIVSDLLVAREAGDDFWIDVEESALDKGFLIIGQFVCRDFGVNLIQVFRARLQIMSWRKSEGVRLKATWMSGYCSRMAAMST